MRTVDGAGRGPGVVARARTDQAGFGLIEVLIALVLAGIVVLGLAAGLLTLVRANNVMDERQRIEQALGSVAEGLEALPYEPCTVAGSPTPADLRSAYDASPTSWTPPTGMSIDVVSIEHWDRTRREFVAACPGSDQGAQQVTVRATWKGRQGTTQVVVRAA